MRLTRFSDYAMRVMLYLAARSDKLCSIAEMSAAYGVSQNHLMKVLHDLGRAGYVSSVRGRAGGFRLARPAEEINVGALLRHTEDDFDLVDCPSCRLAPGCGLSPVLGEALGAFFAVLDGYTLADLTVRKPDFLRLVVSLAPPERPSRRRLAEHPAAV